MLPEYDPEVAVIRDELQGLRTRLPRIDDLLARIPTAVLVADDAGYYVAANPGACALTGYSHEELLRRCVADLTAPREITTSDRLWDAFLRIDRQRGRYVLQRRDGSTVEVEYRAYGNVIPGLHISFISPL